MHAVLFEMKRAFWSSLGQTAGELAEMGLTPARFDWLCAVNLGRGKETQQSRIWRALGLSPATVSRMGRALQNLGLITRETDPDDRRQRVVKLTVLGRCLVRRLRRGELRSQRVRRRAEYAMTADVKDASVRRKRMAAAAQGERMLHLARRAFGDAAFFRYAWSPPTGHPQPSARIRRRKRRLHVGARLQN